MSDAPNKNWQLAMAAAGVAVVALGAYVYFNSEGAENVQSTDKVHKAASTPSKTPVESPPASSAKVEDKKTPGAATPPAPAADRPPASFSPPEGEEEKLPPKEQAAKYKRMGNKYYQGEKYALAVREYTKALEVCPEEDKSDRAIFYGNRAASFMGLGENDKAIADCDAAIECNSRYIKVLNRRGQLLQKIGRHREALNDLTAACLLDMFKTQAYSKACETCLTTIGAERAKELIKTKEFPSPPSSTTITQFLSSFYPAEDHSDHLPVPAAGAGGDEWIRHAQALMNAGKYAEAWAAMHKSFELGHDALSAVALTLRGTMYFLQGGHEDEALADFEKSLESEPQCVDTILKRTSVYTQQLNFEACEAAFKSALEIEDDNASIYFHRGQARFLCGKYNDAADDYKKAVELQPNFEYAHIQLGVTQFQLQQSMTAVETLRGAITKFPGSSSSRNFLGELMLAQQRFQEAENEFLESIRVNPNCPLAYVNLGTLVYQWKQDPKSALEYLRKAVTIDDLCAVAHTHLGTVLLQMKDRDSLAHLDRAIDLARTKSELENAVACREAAEAQLTYLERYPEEGQRVAGMM